MRGSFSVNSLKFKLNFINGGVVSPNKKPQDVKESMLSKISLITAVKGIDKNMPGTPHKAPPAMTTIRQISALSFTFDPIILGMM